MYRRLFPETGHPMMAFAVNHYATILSKTEKQEALALFEEALAIRRRFLKPNDWWLVVSVSKLGAHFLSLGRYADAEPLLIEAFDKLRKLKGPRDPNTVQTLRRLVRLYEQWGKAEEALRFRTLLRESGKK